MLGFIREEFKLSRTLPSPRAGKRYSDLTDEQQREIRSFGFSVEIFKGISDQEVLEVFCRLNMNGVPLNKQELRNGKYFGHFKQTAFSLALNNLEFWRRHKMFTEQAIARMLEVELTSELIIAAIDGMQDKKKSIDEFYQELDEEYPTEKRDKKRFRETMDVIAGSCPFCEIGAA